MYNIFFNQNLFYTYFILYRFITKKEDISTNEELKPANCTSEFEETTSNCVTSEQPFRNK